MRIAALSSLFGKVALGIDDEHFDEHFDEVKQRVGVKADVGLEAAHLKEISESIPRRLCASKPAARSRRT